MSHRFAHSHRRPRGTRAALLAPLLLVALLLAGCHVPQGGDGSGDDDGTPGDSDPPADPTTGDDDADDDGAGGDGDGDDDGEAVTLAFGARGDHGEVLVDGQGRTLYVFTRDDPGVSNCYDQCAGNWPPLYASEIAAAPDAIRDQLDLVPRDDGRTQVTYEDLPLYLFARDAQPGDVNGDGVAGVWFVVRPPPDNQERLDMPGMHNVTTSEVQYHTGTTGYLAMPTNATDAPGVVMIHEWWGLNDHIRHMADQLATHGYRVLAVDLFDGNVATTPAGAQEQVANLDQEEATANMRAAADHLRSEGASSIVSLGWCFGGSQALQLALSGEELSATVLYYATQLVTEDDRLDAIEWPVLGIFGEDDQVISVDQVRAFETALDNVSVENQIYIYPDVGHAFANPSGDWAPWQTVDAWTRTLSFLDSNADGSEATSG